MRIQKTEDGRAWRRGPWKTGYSYAMALSGLRTLSVAPERMVIQAAYETMDGGIDRDEDPAYVPSYRTVNFTVEKTDGIWYVAEYTYPETAFARELDAAQEAVRDALPKRYYRAEVQEIRLESDREVDGEKRFAFRVDYTAPEGEYEDALWSAVLPAEGGPWLAFEGPAD